jgi:MoxR-like ATPase
VTATPVTDTTEPLHRTVRAVEQVVVGKPAALRLLLISLLSRGHVLIEDLPGVGKTLMAKSFAQVLGLGFTRIQFTPDLLPSDVVGAAVLDPRSNELVFQPGPVFTNVLLADEINRTPPKTQSALLEAMSESTATVDGVTHALPDPFIVLATDNPIEYEGTYPLPEAQLDRFLSRVRVGYLTAGDEAVMARQRLARRSDRQPVLEPVLEHEELRSLMSALEEVEVSDDVLDYVVRLVQATRDHKDVQVGASPRGTLALVQLARGNALFEGRAYVVPQDVKAVAVPALGHRVAVRPELWVHRLGGDDVVRDLLGRIPTPPLRAVDGSV